MADLTSDRSLSWTADFVDLGGEVIAEHLPITGGRLRGDLNARSLWGGQLDADGPWPTSLAELNRGFIRLGMVVNGEPFPLGWFRITADPKTKWTGGTRWRLEVIDPSIILSRDLITSDLAIPRGTAVAQWCRDRIERIAPGVPVVIGDSPETTRTDLFLDVGTDELEVINTVLGAAVHDPLRALPTGALSAQPWVDPSTRGTAWDFTSGSVAIISPVFGLDTDHLAIPNRVVVEARGDSTDAVPIRGLWEDHDPASPWSREARGSWVTVVVRDADVTSDLAATRMAEREGRERQVAAVTLTVEHAWVPVDLGDVVSLDVGDSELDGLWQVQTQDFNLDTSLVRATWRRI